MLQEKISKHNETYRKTKLFVKKHWMKMLNIVLIIILIITHRYYYKWDVSKIFDYFIEGLFTIAAILASIFIVKKQLIHEKKLNKDNYKLDLVQEIIIPIYKIINDYLFNNSIIMINTTIINNIEKLYNKIEKPLNNIKIANHNVDLKKELHKLIEVMNDFENLRVNLRKAYSDSDYYLHRYGDNFIAIFEIYNDFSALNKTVIQAINNTHDQQIIDFNAKSYIIIKEKLDIKFINDLIEVIKKTNKQCEVLLNEFVKDTFRHIVE